MRNSNISKIEEAIKVLSKAPFSIADICKQSKVSDPTVRNYLGTSKKIKLKLVSYGKYEVIDNLNPNLKPNQNNDIQPLKGTEQHNYQTMKTPNKQNNLPQEASINSPIQVHGELYLNAYLKGFDRGFELGLKKASELPKTPPLNKATSSGS